MNKIFLEGTIELLLSLIITGVLVFKCGYSIKKNSKKWYIGAWSISLVFSAIAIMVFVGVFEVAFSAWWVRMIRGIISGYLPAAIFMYVMYAGAFSSNHSVRKKLMSIRTELSILGVIFYLPHTVLYTVLSAPYGFQQLLNGEPTWGVQLMTWTGIINSILVVILGVTSSKGMKRRLKKNWKKLHKWSYLFYFSCFAHYMTMSIRGGEYERSVIYIGIYGAYLVLKLRKVYLRRKVKNVEAEIA